MININAMPLIDIHAHAEIFDPKTKKNSFAGEELYALQKKDQVNYMLYLSLDFIQMITLACKHPKEIGAVLWINPCNAKEQQQAESLIKKYPDQIKGIKIHPAFHKYYVSKTILESTFRLVNDYNLLLVSHTGAEDSEAGLFRPLLKKFPDTKLILSHVFPLHESIFLIQEFKNVYADTSYTVDNRESQLYLLNHVGKEKILYGIDGPHFFPLDEKGRRIPQFRKRAIEMAPWYKNNPDVIEHIYFKNAARLLNLEISG